jgi:hypothetical protein
MTVMNLALPRRVRASLASRETVPLHRRGPVDVGCRPESPMKVDFLHQLM